MTRLARAIECPARPLLIDAAVFHIDQHVHVEAANDNSHRVATRSGNTSSSRQSSPVLQLNARQPILTGRTTVTIRLVHKLTLQRRAQDVAVDVDSGVEDPLLSGDAAGSGSEFSGWTVPGALSSTICAAQSVEPMLLRSVARLF